MSNYYAAPTGLAGNSGTAASPWDLQTALNNVSQTSGDTLYLRGGTYHGKFTATLAGGTVRSYPGEWAKIDGYKTTTLTAAIDASQTNITVASTVGLYSGSTIGVDTELMQVSVVNSSTSLTVNRGWSPNFGGAVPHSNGATVQYTGPQITVTGSNTTYRDFEITNSYTNRDNDFGGQDPSGCCGYYAVLRGAGINSPNGSGNSYINLVIHDNLDGIFTGSSSSNTLIYGVLTYNNGHHYYHTGNGWIEGAGNGMYLENSSGYSRIYETLSLNHMGGNQFFGVTGPYVGGDVQGSVFANSGALLRGIRSDASQRNLIFGTGDQQSPTAHIADSHFFHQPGIGLYNMIFGYSAGIDTGSVTNSYFVGANKVNFEAGNIDTLTFTGNKVYSPNSDDTYVSTSPSAYTWNNNTYYNTSNTNDWRFIILTVGYRHFPGWKTATGYDATGTATEDHLPTTVIVRPNAYEAGRAHVIIYAPSDPATVNVDLAASGLVDGQAYVIRNAFDYFGAPVASGSYDAGDTVITLNMADLEGVAEPVGLGYTPDTTAPNFAALMVVPVASVGVGMSNVTFQGVEFY